MTAVVGKLYVFQHKGSALSYTFPHLLHQRWVCCIDWHLLLVATSCLHFSIYLTSFKILSSVKCQSRKEITFCYIRLTNMDHYLHRGANLISSPTQHQDHVTMNTVIMIGENESAFVINFEFIEIWCNKTRAKNVFFHTKHSGNVDPIQLSRAYCHVMSWSFKWILLIKYIMDSLVHFNVNYFRMY